MRIPRTNFAPAAFDDIDHDDQSQETVYQSVGWEAVAQPATEEEYWDPQELPAANDSYRPRFRSPILRGYDPAQYADGTWESHFYLAPNVRFTRTPDRNPTARSVDEAAAAAIEATPIVAEDTLPSESDLLQRLREALEERRRKFEAHPVPEPHLRQDAVMQAVNRAASEQPQADARPQDAAPETPPPAKVVAPAAPAAKPAEITTAPPPSPQHKDMQKTAPGLAYLSDFAFWETMGLGGEGAPTPSTATPRVPPRPEPRTIARVAPAAAPSVKPAAPAPAIVAATPVAVSPEAIVSRFRVVEWQPRSHASQEASPVAGQAAQVSSAAVAVSPETTGPALPANTASIPQTEAADMPPVAATAAKPTTPSAEVPPPSGLARSKPFEIDLANKPVSEETYEFPPRELLQRPPTSGGYMLAQETMEQNAGLLESVLEDFGVRGEIIHVRPGPVVTLYEFEPAPGVKSSRVIGLADDIARSMSALSARVAVIPGRNVIGIELPNATRETVYFREMIESQDFAKTGFKLPICLGKTIGGEPVIAELAKMPHLLVAGTTGSGKSVAINTMILSLLYRFRPDECRLIMVDPKMLELSIYDGIPHLLTPVVTDPKKAVMALKWAVREMEDRYRKMSRLGVRNIDGYNTRAAVARQKGETITHTVQTGFEKGTGEAVHETQEMQLDPMPYIVVIVDEMADLMMVAGKEIEGAIQRLAQMARAAGIHLIMATQRPSVDVITGTIKANFPTRISFQVTSKIDSRTILGEQGAEQLLGQGDMLHMAGGGRISRVHGPFVSDEEVEKVVLHLKAQGRPEYLDTVTADEEEGEEEDASGAVFDKGDMAAEDGNDLYDKAVKVVLRDKKCSTSYIQRRLAIGYNRAASLVERMEKEGLVGPANHVGKREIINAEWDGAE
ncbi:MAG: DNA translocase FtsK [Shinella sp.]|nr:DNA translocase FtsK [Shinella sp.]